MRVVHDDIVGDVRVECNFIVLSCRIDANSSGVVRNVVVRNRQQSCVLDVHVDNTRRCVVEDLEAAVIDVIGRESNADVVLTDILETPSSALIVRHRVVRYQLDACDS